MASESGGRDNQLPQGLMGTLYLGLLSFTAVYLPAIPCTRLFSHLFHSQCKADGLSIINPTQSRQILAHGSKLCVHGSLFSCAHCASGSCLLCTL